MTEVRPSFFPSPDGARDVMRRARARRRRRALATTGGFAVVAAITGVLIGAAGTGTGADRLSVVPAGPDHGSAQQTPGGTATPNHTQPTPPSTAGHSVSASVPPGGSSGPAAGSNPFPAPSPSDPPTPYAPKKRHSANAPITRTVANYNVKCDATYDVQGWCALYSGPTQARRKHPVALSMELCRPSVVGDGTVHFDDTRQISLLLYDASGTQVWAAGQGLKYANTTSAVVVKAGTCLRWTATWDTIAPSGFYAPPGDYTAGIGIDSSDVSPPTNGGDTVTLTD